MLKSQKRLARNIRKEIQTRGRKSNDESLSLYYKVKVKIIQNLFQELVSLRFFLIVNHFKKDQVTWAL